jgi:hypothetical protein
MNRTKIKQATDLCQVSFLQGNYLCAVMFKQSTALFLLIAFAATVFNRAEIVIGYYANTNSYAKNCVNKNLPMMHCNGKCQMTKKLQAEDKKDQQNPERKTENKDQVASSKSFFPTVSIQPTFSDGRLRPTNYTFFPVGVHLCIFQPPA